MSVNFAPGQFYGVRQFGASTSVFDVRTLVASGHEDDVHVHTHQDAHFVLVLTGAYISSARDAADLARAPALIFNPPDTTHRDRFANGIGTFVTVSLSSATFHDLRSVLSVMTDARRLHSPRALTTAFRIAREVRDSRDAVVLESSIWELLASVANQPRLIGNPPRWVLHAYQAIMDRATETRLSVRDVAAEVTVHPVHLARVFRETWGCSPGELIRWRRVDRAADLLRRSNKSGAQIALEAGFVDQSHMTRAFRAAYSVAPGVYRREHVARIQA